MKLNIEPQVIIHGWLGGLGSSIATMRGPMTVSRPPTFPPAHIQSHTGPQCPHCIDIDIWGAE